MRILLLLLLVAFYRPLTGQIVFEELEELDKIPDYFVRTVNESATGSHCVLTDQALYGKSVISPEWLESEADVTNVYEVAYSPDGDLYTKNNSTILHSQDNGETFTTIDFPNGIYFFDYVYLYVLDDDVLYIADTGSGHCFYSLNNGQSWVWTGQYIHQVEPVVRMVGNFIYVSEPYWAVIVARINVTTGQTEIVDMNSVSDRWTYVFSEILDDGTLCFFGFDFFNQEAGPQLLQYRFGEDLVSFGEFPDLPIHVFYAVDSELYSFGSNAAHVFDGIGFSPISYTGLPSEGDKRFLLSSNDHIYVILDDTRIFRSVRSLANPGVISGSVHLDAQKDCVPDITDIGLAYWNITVEGEDFLRVGPTSYDGQYRFAVPEGEFTVSAQPVGSGWELCTDEINVTVDADHLAGKADFLAQATAHCANLSLDFSTPRLRRCFDNYYSIRVRNTGPQASNGTTLVLHLDQFFIFNSASIPHNQVDATTVTFDLGTLELNEEVIFQVFFTLSCEAEPGMEHCMSGNVNADNDCDNERTYAIECQMNIGSFDPNDKRIFNEEGKEAERVDKGEYISYHIRFQNTGTDTAFTVRITDPLSDKLDLSTLEMLSASHPYSYTITDGPVLIALFENILLPDSTTNEPASHGFLKFRIKPLPAFDYGTTIPNTAGIFFDYNDPVLTNEAVLLILPAVGVQEEHDLVDFTVFPNPAQNTLDILMPDRHDYKIESWVIYDVHGRMVVDGMYDLNHTLDMRSLAPGIYTLALKAQGETIGRTMFVKE